MINYFFHKDKTQDNQAPAYLTTNRLNSQTNEVQKKTYLLLFTVFMLFYLITVPIIQIGIGTFSLINDTCPIEPLISSIYLN